MSVALFPSADERRLLALRILWSHQFGVDEAARMLRIPERVAQTHISAVRDEMVQRGIDVTAFERDGA